MQLRQFQFLKKMKKDIKKEIAIWEKIQKSDKPTSIQGFIIHERRNFHQDSKNIDYI